MIEPPSKRRRTAREIPASAPSRFPHRSRIRFPTRHSTPLCAVTSGIRPLSTPLAQPLAPSPLSRKIPLPPPDSRNPLSPVAPQPLPLGGTSNHFRRAALLKVGAWDAWNVTEDADLGIRLARAGFRARVLDATTWEEAPNRLSAWLRQRTRWLKGWMQTYAVHMRRPGDLLRRLGLRRFLAFQFLIGGMVASALVHPLFVLLLAGQVLAGNVFLGLDHWVMTVPVVLGAANLAAGYGTGFAMGALGLKRRPMRRLALELSGLPAYWLLMSLAAYRALWDLARRPFAWQKTAHGLSRTVAPLPRLARRRLSGATVTGSPAPWH